MLLNRNNVSSTKELRQAQATWRHGPSSPILSSPFPPQEGGVLWLISNQEAKLRVKNNEKEKRVTLRSKHDLKINDIFLPKGKICPRSDVKLAFCNWLAVSSESSL